MSTRWRCMLCVSHEFSTSRRTTDVLKMIKVIASPCRYVYSMYPFQTLFTRRKKHLDHKWGSFCLFQSKERNINKSLKIQLKTVLFWLILYYDYKILNINKNTCTRQQCRPNIDSIIDENEYDRDCYSVEKKTEQKKFEYYIRASVV